MTILLMSTLILLQILESILFDVNRSDKFMIVILAAAIIVMDVQ